MFACTELGCFLTGFCFEVVVFSGLIFKKVLEAGLVEVGVVGRLLYIF
jgi:tetrahydromethanopterin S-methyltransferase subunit E